MGGGYGCRCGEGWEGADCSGDRDECKETEMDFYGDSSPTHGCSAPTPYCINRPGYYLCCSRAGRCGCPPGYATPDGRRCARKTCATHRCPRGAACRPLDEPPYVSCSCPEGWRGARCDKDMNECRGGWGDGGYAEPTHRCKSGRCQNERGGYRCDCYSGFTGRWCEEKVAICAPDTCSGRGACAELGWWGQEAKFRCSCERGYTGHRCQVDELEELRGRLEEKEEQVRRLEEEKARLEANMNSFQGLMGVMWRRVWGEKDIAVEVLN